MAEKNRYHCIYNCNVDGEERCPEVFEADDLPPSARLCAQHRPKDPKKDR